MFTHQIVEKEKEAQASVHEKKVAHPVKDGPETAEQNSSPLLALQSSLGNRYVQRLLDRSRPRLVVQPKLRLAPAGDRYEQEADQAAETVWRAASSGAAAAVPVQQLRASTAGHSVAPEIESQINRAKGNGRPLPRSFRQKMEQTFAADFGRVNLHIGETADHLNRSLQARAFTTGQDIFFRRGEYNPASSEGQQLLAHELTHVLQQQPLHPQKPVVQRSIGDLRKDNFKDIIIVNHVNGNRYKIVNYELRGKVLWYQLQEIEHEEKKPGSEEKKDVSSLAASSEAKPFSGAPQPPPPRLQAAKKTGPTAMELAREKLRAKGGLTEKKVLTAETIEPIKTGEFEKGFVEVREDDINYGREDDPDSLENFNRIKRERETDFQQQAEKAKAMETKYPEQLLVSKADYSFEWWFNYMWKEVPDGVDKKRIYEWAQAYNPDKAVDIERRAILEDMLKLGFVGYDEGAFKSVSAVKEAPQGEMTKYHQTILPSLKKTGLAYRSDSRLPELIKAHGGSKSRSRIDALVQEMNMGNGVAWNPFSDPDRRNKLWLRRGSVDNDLNTVVSLAVDPRDAVKFPLPGALKADKTRVEGGKDEAHLYVIYVKEVLPTSELVQEAFDASSFGRGEMGAIEVPYNTHLLHIISERAFADQSVAFVAGRVRKVEKMQKESVYESLPLETQEGLKELMKLLTGEMNWLVHGTPEADVPRHGEISEIIEMNRNFPKLIAELEENSRYKPHPDEREFFKNNLNFVEGLQHLHETMQGERENRQRNGERVKRYEAMLKTRFETLDIARGTVAKHDKENTKRKETLDYCEKLLETGRKMLRALEWYTL